MSYGQTTRSHPATEIFLSEGKARSTLRLSNADAVTVHLLTALARHLTGVADPISIFIRLIGVKGLGAVVLLIGDPVMVGVLVWIFTAFIYLAIAIVVGAITDLWPGLLTIFTGARLFTGTEMEYRYSNRSSITGVVISLSIATTYRTE